MCSPGKEHTAENSSPYKLEYFSKSLPNDHVFIFFSLYFIAYRAAGGLSQLFPMPMLHGHRHYLELPCTEPGSVGGGIAVFRLDSHRIGTCIIFYCRPTLV